MAEPLVRLGGLLFFAADRTGPRARGGGQDGATPRTAKRHGQSTEEEARGILRGALKQEDVPGQWTGN
jgi:hypothetical protein